MAQSFIKAQKALAHAIRYPDDETTFDRRRLAVYQELFFNNVEGFCSSSFPVLKSVLEKSKWNELVRSFFQQHKCETPHFIEISQEYLSYLADNQKLLPWKWCVELAHYEWVELACSVAEFPESEEFMEWTPELERGLVASVPDTSWPLAYNYPVHSISLDNCHEIEEEATFLMVYRDISDDVRFINTDAATVHLLNYVQSIEKANMEVLTQFLCSAPFEFEHEVAKQFLRQCLPELLKRRILIINN